jgi:hypothetical protein
LELGSKYVQSHIGNSYAKAKTYLEKGTIVLFSGTPCQIDGLKSYLSKSYSNLLLVEFICRGVPNARMFNRYLSLLAHKLHGTKSTLHFEIKNMDGDFVEAQK